MDKLNASGKTNMARRRSLLRIPRIATQPGGSQREQGTDTLTASGDQMRCKLRDQRYRALHPRQNGTIAPGHVVAQQRRQPPQRFLTRSRLRSGVRRVNRIDGSRTGGKAQAWFLRGEAGSAGVI